MTKDIDDSEFFEDDEISKSQVKRDMIALQELGIKVMSLNKQQLETLPLNETILAAVEESKRVTQHEAKRRHAQYVGKLMRQADHEAIQFGLDLLDPSSEAHSQFFQQVERWRDRMMDNLSDCPTIFSVGRVRLFPIQTGRKLV